MSSAAAKPVPAASLSELLLCQSPGCSWVLDRAGAFQAVYGDALRVFGRAAAELVNLNFTDLSVPPARSLWIGRLERVFAAETLAAPGRFGEEASAFSISMFPVRSPAGEVAFAGCTAHEMPEAALVLRALEALEIDRARLAQLLHDYVGQSLSAAGLQLDLLRMDLADTTIAIPNRIGEIQAILETLIGLVRDVHRELHPALAERVGLRAALDGLAGRLRTDFKGNVRVFADSTALPAPDTAAALYRIAQEAAGYAARRAGCSAIEILLKSLRSGPALEIRDNGPGFDADSAQPGAALEFLVMRYFADRAGIELQIDSAPDRGTVVRALCRSANSLRAAEPRA
jgi:signal transduction histidine kinase